jgi:hypothetical protein
MDQRPDWLLLIQHWVRGGGTGYSVPFLVGARALSRGFDSASLNCARELLEEMLNPMGRHPTLELTWCRNLDVPVFGISRESIPGVTLASEHTGAPSVIVRSDIRELWGDTRHSIMAGLIDHAAVPIAAGHFSRTWDQSWTPFADEEKSRITNILSMRV